MRQRGRTLKPYTKAPSNKTWEPTDRLANARVVQKNLLYVIGLSPRIAKEEVYIKNI
jgi:hypothetical protein